MKLFLGLTLGFTCIVYIIALSFGIVVSFVAWDLQPMRDVAEQVFDWAALRIVIATAAVCAFCFWLDSEFN